MPFPKAIAKVQRDSILSDIIETMDNAERLWRNLADVAPHNVALDRATYAVVSDRCQDAFTALFNARVAIDAAIELETAKSPGHSRKV